MKSSYGKESFPCGKESVDSDLKVVILEPEMERSTDYRESSSSSSSYFCNITECCMAITNMCEYVCFFS